MRFILIVRYIQFVPLLVLILLLNPYQLNAQALRELQVTFQLNGQTKTQNIFCNGKTPGTAKTKRGSLAFTPFSKSIKALKQKASPSNKLTTLKALNTAGKKACKTGSGGSPPQGTPTPVPSLGNFDNLGNVTAQGKIVFGIPSQLNANISQGRGAYLAYCTGCHVERTGWSFPNLREAIRESPMLYDEAQIPDQLLADMTAYLNRFRAN